MNKSALKNFATSARTELREKIKIKALQIGITEENIKKESVQSSDAVFIEGRQLTKEEQVARNKLIEEIKIKGYNQVVEEVAYTWFNRFTALRFMEVNNYLPSRVKVLSSKTQGSYEPDIIKEALNVDLDIDKELVYKLKTSSDNDAIDKLYKYLIIKQCNALNDILPLMFEKIMDYTELLFPDGLLAEGSFLRVMTDPNNIPEEDWKNVEVIGWLYQYYISERKDEVFAGLKKNKKIGKNDIAPATQLFTPHWIVRYMVENSVGKLWQEGHPNEDLKKEWKYYIEEAEQNEEVQKQLDKLKEESKKLKIEDVKIIDPAMGSGHILVYTFDLLYDIYLSEGYIAHEIPKLIIEKNLYGIDIDKRAFQLAYFALMMKGRSKSRRFFDEQVEVKIIPIKESNEFPKEAIKYFLNSKSLEMEKRVVETDLEYLIDIFYDAKEYGSILKVKKINCEPIEKRLEEIKNQAPADIFELQYRDKILDIMPELVKQGKIMSNKYDALITNPPYMGLNNMNNKLKKYTESNFLVSKQDLYTVFLEKSMEYTKSNGFIAQINQHSWMFTTRFEKLRKKLVKTSTIYNMVHLGAGAFEEISGEVVQSTTFTIRNSLIDSFVAIYVKAIEQKTALCKKVFFEDTIREMDDENLYYFKTNKISEVTGSPIAYWLTDSYIKVFENKSISNYGKARKGMVTADNDRFIRYWYEILITKTIFNCKNREYAKKSGVKWFPYQKGGGYRKWYGLNENVVNWENDGEELFNMKKEGYKTGSTNHNLDFIFKESITWSRVSTMNFSARLAKQGYLFDDSGPLLYIEKDSNVNYILSFLNTKVANDILKFLNPTMLYQAGNIATIPIIIDTKMGDLCNEITSQNISISRTDWDFFETSWDFRTHPILNKELTIKNGKLKTEKKTVEQSFNRWKEYTTNQFNQLKSNEEELNRIFIDIYGLEDELTPEVEDKDITISKVVEEKSEEDRQNSYTIDRKQAIESFLSYAVGCMFGRYSLDKEGLIYAGGEFDISKYPIFQADKDNIIPILSDSYFEDDIVSKFVDFVKITFSEDTLNENLKYIAESLGMRNGESPKETIRRYFISDFYKNHTQIYKKRPIYWLFSSGKEKAFNALIYMHRYDKSTLARIRTDYLHLLQSKLDVERSNLKNNIAEEDNTAQKKKYEKQLKDLEKKISELKKYDETLHTMADRMIEIDLDDGVKVNYEKFEGLVQKI